MRTFHDEQGQDWQVALIDASYGVIMLVFSPLNGADIYQRIMDVNNLSEAQGRLDALDDTALRKLLANADIMPVGTDSA